MEYLEAVAIKRLRPDGLPDTLAHLPEEADRVIKLHHAMKRSGDTDLLVIPILSHEQRERVNKVLIANLAIVCGRLDSWLPVVARRRPIKPIELRKDETGHERPQVAKPGPNAKPLDWQP